MSSTDTDSPESDAPVDTARTALLEALAGEFGDAVLGTHLDPGRDVWARVHTDAWEAVGRFLRDGLDCRYFCYLSAVDWLPSPFGRSMDSDVDNLLEGVGAKEPEPMTHGVTGGDTRFQLIARVYSIAAHLGVHLKVDVPDDTHTIASWTRVYGGANWHERETFEMFGITFDGHPSLRKLYLPGDFEGFPLRKDFPLVSRLVKPWPGIVDVEGMPGVADDEGGDPS
ncbi:MAG: NADH-quinone oxidoreductase subunit C [Acidimicrobiales bacterium]|nr:NADH-quinone oxidoreductase subunit C [Acidimicrobiales bacterium]